jgi:hypothetical protein
MNAADRSRPVSATAAAIAPPSAPIRLVAAVVSGGNRCGHEPSRPRGFEPPAHHASHLKILVKLQEAVRAYFADPAVLPGLNAANGSARPLASPVNCRAIEKDR